MKVAVVGATGNAGTALLGALRAEDRIEQVVGIARRLPDTAAAPYDAARWEQVDIGAPLPDVDHDPVVDRLAAVLEGVDAVVHLAWLIQPNRRRDVMRRTNVEGTRRVVQACLRAGVGHLVCASSVGAYSAVDDDRPRDESWPTDGIPTSHYAVDKAAQERVLDEAESSGLAVARLRPALVFDAEAGAQITRLFLGGLIPPALLRPGAMPALPLPAGLRLQVVHGEDLADAYLRALLRRATGAFNVAADPVLRGQDLADVVDHGRVLPIPAAALRPMVALAWRARAVAADPGWLDMGMSVPIMDTTRARTELSWQPRHDARSTLRELLDAMADGEGTASPPMRPRENWPRDQVPPGQVKPGGVVQPGRAHVHRLPAGLERDVVGLYLTDHLSGATAGAERCERMAQAYADTEMGPELDELAVEIRAEREFLRELVDSLVVRRRPYRRAAAWTAERIGRLKTNDRPLGSPMTPVLELEVMRGAVAGKLAGWQTLGELAPDLGLPPELFHGLADRAREQALTLERLHRQVVGESFRA